MTLRPAALPKAIVADAYTRYTRRFFARWSPLYDAFAAPIGFVYAAAARIACLPGRRSVLDLCTGTGELALRAAELGADVTAIDLTPAMLERARRKGRRWPIRWLEMDARALAFPDRSFDVAVFSFALHDMPRQARTAALAEASRVARDGVVVLDYELSRRPALAAAARRLLGTFETAYLAGFLADGGIRGAFTAAGLQGTLLARPLPGLFAIAQAVRP